MRKQATGTFDVSTQPVSEPNALPGRMTLDKQFQGDLVATAHGEMLTALTAVEGSAAYVAIEHVTGTLHGRTGSFVFQHTGVMDRGKPHLAIHVVPDSGTEQLTGITGDFSLTIVDGTHSYTFDYSLPD